MPDRLTSDLIRQRLSPRGCRGAARVERAGAEPADAANRPVQRAGVLLPLYQLDGAWHLIFIRRAEHQQDRHSGEVGFPGGCRQVSDPDCTATALREAREEIGLAPNAVQILGELRPLHTVSHFLVTPVVGCVAWPQPLRPDPREVSRIFSIPLAWLADHAHHQVRTYPAAGHPEARDLIFFDEYDGELLWGVTARITLDFLACLTAPPSRDPN